MLIVQPTRDRLVLFWFVALITTGAFMTLESGMNVVAIMLTVVAVKERANRPGPCANSVRNRGIGESGSPSGSVAYFVVQPGSGRLAYIFQERLAGEAGIVPPASRSGLAAKRFPKIDSGCGSRMRVGLSPEFHDFVIHQGNIFAVV
jgi:hypothetical protein